MSEELAPKRPLPAAQAGETARVEVSGATREEQFTAFMRDAGPVLTRLALLLSGDRHHAEELVQQTLVRTYEHWDRACERDPLPYARQILANLRIDTWRRRRREVLWDAARMPDAVGLQPADASLPLVNALQRLAARRRRVVVLRYVEGLSEAQVAEILGVPVGTVKSTASRGLADLRALLSQEPSTAPGREPT